MATLFERLDNLLGDINIDVEVDSELSKWLAIAQTIAQLIDNPPTEFSDYLDTLTELELPDLGVATDLLGEFQQLEALIPNDISEVNGDLLAQLDGLESTAVGEIAGVIGPLLTLIQSMQTLLQSDPTCGLLENFLTPSASEETDPAQEPPAEEEEPAEEPLVEEGVGSAQESFSQEQVDNAKALIDALPTPLTVANLLPWLSGFWGNNPLPYNLLRAVPVLDDIRGPLATLSQWQGLSASQIIDQFVLVLNQLAAIVIANTQTPISDLANSVNNLLAPVDLVDAKSQFQTLNSQFNLLADAVNSADLSDVPAAIALINSAQAALNNHFNDWVNQVADSIDAHTSAVERLPETLQEHITELISLVQPRPAMADLFGEEGVFIPDFTIPEDNPLQAVFDTLLSYTQRLLDAIDVSDALDVVNEPIEAVTNQVTEINQALVGVTLAVSNQLAELNTLIDSIDISSAQAQLVQAINDFATDLQTQLVTLFDPVRTGLEAIVTELDSALDSVDPSAVEDGVNEVVGLINSVFADPAVQNALDKIKELNQLAETVDEISFTPLTNTVIDGIEEIDKALEQVGDNLEPPLSDMLDAAMSVLPADIQPLTDPLIDRLGEIIEAGPVQFIEQIKPLPEQVFNQISQYNPENLIGDKLNGPFNQALDLAESFDPDNLLAQLEAKFDELKQRLRDNADPQQLLQPVVDLHRQASVALAELNPSELIEPLDQKIQAITGAVAEQIQIDQLLQPLTDIIAQINRQTDTFTKGIDLVRHLLNKLSDLNNAPAQIDAWVDSLFDLIPDGTDATALTLPIAAVSDAIEQSKTAQLSTFIIDQWQAVSDQLNDLQPASCMNELVMSLTAISGPALAELPDSAEKTQLQNWLDNIDITAPELTQILNQASGLHNALIGTLADFDALWSDWDQRFHRAGGALDNINLPGADLSAIKTLLREAVDRQLATPLKSVLGKLDAIQAMVGSLLDVFETLVQGIQTRVHDLLSTPEAILGLGEALQGVVDAIGTVNLDFLQNSIDVVFTEVSDKFSELDPVSLQQALGDTFDETLDAFNFSQIIPENSFDHLSQTFADTLAKLRTLDPSEVLVKPLQAVFDEQIQPLIDSVDITPLLEALVDRLENLDEELKDEMVRVNSAYQELLRQAPSAGEGASVGF